MKNNFMQRAITGIIFVAVLIGCILGEIGRAHV